MIRRMIAGTANPIARGIIDISGKVAYQQNEINDEKSTIETSGFESGIYFVILKNKIDGMVERGKFVVVK